jgi:hypothetical protein
MSAKILACIPTDILMIDALGVQSMTFVHLLASLAQKIVRRRIFVTK